MVLAFSTSMDRAMTLDYLDFDYSEDEDGNSTWDAMASVPAARWNALVQEVSSVLRWATKQFRGTQGALDEGGDWDFDLSAQDDDSGRALRWHWSASSCTLEVTAPQEGGYATLTLTLTGNTHFAQSMQQQFDLE